MRRYLCSCQRRFWTKWGLEHHISWAWSMENTGFPHHDVSYSLKEPKVD